MAWNTKQEIKNDTFSSVCRALPSMQFSTHTVTLDFLPKILLPLDNYNLAPMWSLTGNRASNFVQLRHRATKKKQEFLSLHLILDMLTHLNKHANLELARVDCSFDGGASAAARE